jgi:hypothetical protein
MNAPAKVQFQRFPCPVCGHLRPDNDASCSECHWGEGQIIARRPWLQFDLATMFDFMIIAGFVALAIRMFIWLALKVGVMGAIVLIVIFAAMIYPFVALYRWWSTDNF